MKGRGEKLNGEEEQKGSDGRRGKEKGKEGRGGKGKGERKKRRMVYLNRLI